MRQPKTEAATHFYRGEFLFFFVIANINIIEIINAILFYVAYIAFSLWPILREEGNFFNIIA